MATIRIHVRQLQHVVSIGQSTHSGSFHKGQQIPAVQAESCPLLSCLLLKPLQAAYGSIYSRPSLKRISLYLLATTLPLSHPALAALKLLRIRRNDCNNEVPSGFGKPPTSKRWDNKLRDLTAKRTCFIVCVTRVEWQPSVSTWAQLRLFSQAEKLVNLLGGTLGSEFFPTG